jgi:hypothetical protein
MLVRLWGRTAAQGLRTADDSKLVFRDGNSIGTKRQPSEDKIEAFR